MEDLNSAASLIKTVQFPGFHTPELLCTRLVWGCMLTSDEDYQLYLVPFEKRALFDAATLSEETIWQLTGRNLIYLGAKLVDLNTTSLVFIEKATGQENQGQDYLCMKDFWISRTNTA